MSTLEQVARTILDQRGPKAIAELDQAIAALALQLTNLEVQLVAAVADKHALTTAMGMIIAPGAALGALARVIPVADELSEAKAHEARLLHKRGKLQSDMDLLKTKRARWLALEKVLTTTEVPPCP